MKDKARCIAKKILSKLLVLLGFSTTFVFMACYGPKPNYASVDFDEADSVAVDSTVVDSTEVDTKSGD